MTDPSTTFDQTFTRRDAPKGTRFTEIRTFPIIDSTNRYLRDAALAEERDGLVAVAEHQTNGRGRLGRKWDSKPGATLLLSVLIRPRDVKSAQLLSCALGLAITDACKLVADVDAQLKWPNDVYVDVPQSPKKIAGVLSELVTVDKETNAVVLGVGVNLNWGGTLPDALKQTATSLDELANAPIDHDTFIDVLLRALHERLARPSWLMQAYRQRCGTIGQHVRLTIGDQTLVGVVKEIDDSGALVLQVKDGKIHIMHAGDVTHLRLA